MVLQAASDDEIPQALIDLVSSVPGVVMLVLTLIPVFCLVKAGTSFRFRKVRFPLAWALGVIGASASLTLFFIFMGPQGWSIAEHWAMPVTNVVLLALYFGLPIIHRLSGFHPAEAEIPLPGWRADRRNREFVLSELRTRMQALGLRLADAKRWGYDLAAQGMVRGTVEPGKRIPYMVFVNIPEGPADIVVSLRADNMDVVISDTGESANCQVLLAAVAQRLQEPPFVAEQGSEQEITDSSLT